MRKLITTAILCALLFSSFCTQANSQNTKKFDSVKSKFEGSWELFDPVSNFVFAIFTVSDLEKNTPGYKFFIDYKRIEESQESISSVGYILGKSLFFNIDRDGEHYSYLFKVKKHKDSHAGLEVYNDGLLIKSKAYSIRKVAEGQGQEYPIPPNEEFETPPTSLPKRLARKIARLNKRLNGEWLVSNQSEDSPETSKITIKQFRYSFIKSHPVEVIFDYESINTGAIINDLVGYKVGRHIFMNIPNSQLDMDICFDIKSKKGLVTANEQRSRVVFEKSESASISSLISSFFSF